MELPDIPVEQPPHVWRLQSPYSQLRLDSGPEALCCTSLSFLSPVPICLMLIKASTELLNRTLFKTKKKKHLKVLVVEIRHPLFLHLLTQQWISSLLQPHCYHHYIKYKNTYNCCSCSRKSLQRVLCVHSKKKKSKSDAQFFLQCFQTILHNVLQLLEY